MYASNAAIATRAPPPDACASIPGPQVLVAFIGSGSAALYMMAAEQAPSPEGRNKQRATLRGKPRTGVA